MARNRYDPDHNPGPPTPALLACAECGDEYRHGLNSDFCSERCEEAWRKEHIRPCPECRGEGEVEYDCAFMGGTPTRVVVETCPACHGECEVQV